MPARLCTRQEPVEPHLSFQLAHAVQINGSVDLRSTARNPPRFFGVASVQPFYRRG